MRKLLSFLGLAIAILVLITVFSLQFFKITPQFKMETLENGWVVMYRGQRYINTNLERLSEQVGYTFSRGDIITLNMNKPLQDLECDFPYLFFKTQFCAYEVFLNDQLIEASDLDALDSNRFVGTGYNMVPLGEDYVGKKLSIKLYVTENSTRVDMVSPTIGSFDDLARRLIYGALFPLFTGIFLILFGQVFLVISLTFYLRTSGVRVQIISSIISVLLGFWIITAFDVSGFMINKSAATLISYGSIYLIIPCIYLLLNELHKRQDNTLLRIMGFSTLGFSVLFITLHILGLVHINHFIYPYYVLSFTGILIFLYYVWTDIRSRKRNASVNIIMLGLFVLSMCLVLYVGIALSMKLVDYRQSFLATISIPTGAIFFVITQLLNYFIFMTHSFAQRKEYASLSQIAFEDTLTGLFNRVKSDEKMAELDKTTDDFCLISLDLNGLKEVNDNAGHPAGDRLLRSFANALYTTFNSIGTCYRIGGDEFLVITSTTDTNTIDSLLKQLDKKLLDLDESDPEINHSVSYGYAFRSETAENEAHAAFMLADKKMYDYKRKYYSHMMKR